MVGVAKSVHLLKRGMFPFSIHETHFGSSRREDFWFIVAARSEDEAETRAGQSAGRTSAEAYQLRAKREKHHNRFIEMGKLVRPTNEAGFVNKLSEQS